MGVEWRTGQRAVFGLYSQSARSAPVPAYFVFDEATGALVEGFDVEGGLLAYLNPGPTSRFAPLVFGFPLDEDGRNAEVGRVMPMRALQLARAPLPAGAYTLAVSVTDLSDNETVETVGVTVHP